MERIWERGRHALHASIELAKVGRTEEALSAVDDVLAEAIRENRTTWVSTLCGHAAVLAYAMGKRARQIDYEEMALPFARDWRFAAYNFAQLLMSDGQMVRAQRYAREAYKLSIASEAQADRDLAAAIRRQWPDAAEGGWEAHKS